jgi:hypothetical protein
LVRGTVVNIDLENAKGAPLMAAVIVMVAILAITGVAISFQGNVMF